MRSASDGLASVDGLTVGHSRLRDGAVAWYLVGLAAGLELAQCVRTVFHFEPYCLVKIPVEIPGGISEELYSISPVLPKNRLFEHLPKREVG